MKNNKFRIIEIEDVEKVHNSTLIIQEKQILLSFLGFKIWDKWVTLDYRLNKAYQAKDLLHNLNTYAYIKHQ